MSIAINPKELAGTVKIPPSKSMAHRLIICAALSKGKSVVSNLSFSDDIKATLFAFEKMGRTIEMTDNSCIISGDISNNGAIIDCNESGSTLRFLVPIISVLGGGKVTGKKRLFERPLSVYQDIFEAQSMQLKSCCPLKIEGKLKADEFVVRGDISSQFISGLMLAAPLMDGDVTIKISTELQSKAYVDMTIIAMKTYGVNVDVICDNKHYLIKGGQSYKATSSTVEGDWSQSAFWILAGLNSKSGLLITGLNKKTLQGDKVIYDIAKRMNANIHDTDNGLLVKKSTLTQTDVDISQCPDLAPAVAGMMSLTEKMCMIKNCERLKIKESDRVQSIISVINDLGGKAYAKENTIVVEKTPIGGKIKTCHDHRIAMMAAALSCFCEKAVIIDDETVVNKSYPNFWEDFKRLGGEYV
jgi:3-phosphoshikimate 1-carboxyvinyltransferase